MACFLAPAAEAIVTTVIQKKLEKKEQAEQIRLQETGYCDGGGAPAEPPRKVPWSRKLKWLNSMLWGGCALLCVEHIWHGEVVPWPPFLTAMNTPSEIVPMLKEIALFGGSMVVLITVVWFLMTLVADKIAERSETECS